MFPPPFKPHMSLVEEGIRCKDSLKAFTADLIAKLRLPPEQSELLLKCDNLKADENVYLYFPFCFREVFPNVNLEDIRSIALSGVVWMSYMRTQDDALDKPTEISPSVLFVRDIYLRYSLHLLYQLFPAGSRFWDFYSSYSEEYARAVLQEKQNHSSSVMSAYDKTEFHIIAKGKAAMAKYSIAAQAVLTEEEDLLPILAESIDCFHVGYQYWDDLVDWKEDLKYSSYSLLLTRALEKLGPDRHAKPYNQLREEVGRIVYYSGIAEEHLRLAFDWFERAYELSLLARCQIWAAHVKRLQKQTADLAIDLRSIMATNTAVNRSSN